MHDAVQVSIRWDIPTNPARAMRVVEIYRCDQFGCPLRGEDVEHETYGDEAALADALRPRGMLASPCAHIVAEVQPAPPVVVGTDTAANPDGFFAGCRPGCQSRQAANPGMGLHDPECPWLHRITPTSPAHVGGDRRPYDG